MEENITHALKKLIDSTTGSRQMVCGVAGIVLGVAIILLSSLTLFLNHYLSPHLHVIVNAMLCISSICCAWVTKRFIKGYW